jgi:hypothetical protein
MRALPPAPAGGGRKLGGDVPLNSPGRRRLEVQRARREFGRADLVHGEHRPSFWSFPVVTLRSEPPGAQHIISHRT